MEVNIIIPTAGRASTIITHKFIANSVICCPESELEEYKKFNPEENYLPHPDTIKGIGMKRQWIWDKYPNVFMADDDLEGIFGLTSKIGEVSKVSPERSYLIIQNCANLAKIAGCHLYGFSPYPVPEHYSGHKPIVLSGYINGCGFGLLEGGKEKLVFNPQIITNNDFYICGLNAHYYRKCFIDYRFCMGQDSFGNNKGGCADVRTREVEKQDYELLRAYFGECIHIKNSGATRPKHEHSKRLTVPY